MFLLAPHSLYAGSPFEHIPSYAVALGPQRQHLYLTGTEFPLPSQKQYSLTISNVLDIKSSNLNYVGGCSDKTAKLFYRGVLSICSGLGTNPLADAW